MPGRSTNEPTNYMAFGFQSAKDTEATTFQFLRHLDGTGFDLDEQVERVHEGGDGQEIGLIYKTAVTADGQMVVNSRPEVGHRLGVAVMGADTATVPQSIGTAASGICNEHTAVPTSSMPYLTVEQFWADVVERGVNAQVNELTLEFEAGRPLKITPAFITGGSAYRRAGASALTPTREAGQPFMYPGASVVVDGAGNTKVTKGSIKITRGVDGEIRTTGLNREDVVVSTFETEVALTLKYEDATLYDKVHYVGGTQIPINLATGSLRLTSVFGSGSNVRYQEWGVNQFTYDQARVNKLNPDGQTMYLDVLGSGYKGATHQAYVKTLIASAAAIA